jgi:NitT/TauT family transport system ATP-binding protein
VATTGEALLGASPSGTRPTWHGLQSYSSYPWLTVLDNVAFGLKLRGVPRDERERVARAWIEKVGLKGTEKKYPKQLSGGMRQRVAIARTLAVKPQSSSWTTLRSLDADASGCETINDCGKNRNQTCS